MLINQTLQRFQQRVIFNNKYYSLRFTLFSIAILGKTIVTNTNNT